MVDTALLEALELLTPAEQKAVLAVAEYLKSQRLAGETTQDQAEALIAEMPPHFTTTDDGLSPARLAARQFMRENPALMRLLAQ